MQAVFHSQTLHPAPRIAILAIVPTRYKKCVAHTLHQPIDKYLRGRFRHLRQRLEHALMPTIVGVIHQNITSF